MRSLFNTAQFARFDLGRHVLAQQTAFSITDYLSKVGLDPSDIDKVQDPKFKEEAKADYEKCKAKGLDTAEGLACLAALGAKVYAKLKEEEKAPAATLPVARAPESSFPWIPVTLGVAAAGGLVYFLATRGK